MVKRAEFEQALMNHIIPAVGAAQDDLGRRFGVKFAVQVDWDLGDGYHFEDEQPSGVGG